MYWLKKKTFPECVILLDNLDFVRTVLLRLSCVGRSADSVISLPVQLQCEAIGSSSSEHGSVSPDCDSKQDIFFQKKKNSGSENLLKPPNSNYLRCVRTF